MDKVKIVIFAGRKKFMKIQMLYLEKLISLHPNVFLDIWNFSRNSADNDYVRSLCDMERTTVFNQLYAGDNEVTECTKTIDNMCICVKCRPGNWSAVYKYYAESEDNDYSTYVKIDDDLIFIDVPRFDNWIAAAQKYPNSIVSANVINNGICAFYNSNLKNNILSNQDIKLGNFGHWIKRLLMHFVLKWKLEQWWWLSADIAFCRLSHHYFLAYSKSLETIRSDFDGEAYTHRSRFSINALAFSGKVMKEISTQLGVDSGFNDEAIISRNFNIAIFGDMIASHFSFSVQQAAIGKEEEENLLSEYYKIASELKN